MPFMSGTSCKTSSLYHIFTESTQECKASIMVFLVGNLFLILSQVAAT